MRPYRRFAWVTLLLCGCMPRGGLSVSATPITDPSAIVTSLERAARLDAPTKVFFEWKLEEQGSDVSGEGTARSQPPFQARLDLFAGSGDTAGEARLVNDQLWLPGNMPEGMIPPPELLWAALGVFRPGVGAQLVSARGDVGAAVELRYRSARGDDLLFTVEGDRLHDVALLEDGHRTHELTLTTDAGARFPKQAVYRNLAEFRTLTLTTKSIENVEAFPADVFAPTP
jgi:hypothetical protein